MKEATQSQQQKQPAITPQLVKVILPITSICLIFGIGGMISVFSQKTKNIRLTGEFAPNEAMKTVDKAQLPPYTMIVEGESVVIKFHGTDSNIQLNDLSNKQKKCLTNGGGIGCVLPSYVPADEAKDTEPNQRLGMKKRTSSISLFFEDNWLVLGLFVGFMWHFIGIFGRKN